MKTVFVVCQHGDEQLPLQVIKKYPYPFLVANPGAMKKKLRFLESDLNRSFPGSPNGNLEEQIAYRLLPQIKKADVVIDLHTASCQTPLFAILTKVTDRHLQTARQLGIKKVVYMKKSIASGKALIDHVNCGVSVECGKEGLAKTKKDLLYCLENYKKSMQQIDCEYFIVYDILKKSRHEESLPSSVVNFKEISISGNKFYPVLAGEKYPGVLSLMARRVPLNELVLESNHE